MHRRTIAATTHGSYLTSAAATAAPAPLLVGFHGYAENAEIQLDRLRAIPGSDQWRLVSIQALHQFYQRRTNLVVASWMTSQDRQLAIADNVAYVETCLRAVAEEWPSQQVVVFAGFSQGVGMAFRAAVHTTYRVAGVIAVGGDVPPEITPAELNKIPAALLARGNSDPLYTGEQFVQDEQRLREASVNVRALTLNAGHEWSPDLQEAASGFLQNLRQNPASA